MRQHLVRGVIAVAIVAGLSTPSMAQIINGNAIPTEFSGFLVASQRNQTGFGNNVQVSEPGILVGSELDSLYFSWDGFDVWIGIPGNLPNKLASSQSFVILIDGNRSDDPGATPVPNLLTFGALDGSGGGHDALQNLNGTVLEPGFYPETAIVVNRFGETTYADSWYLPTNAQDAYSADHVSLDPYQTGLPGAPLFMSWWMDTTNVVGVDADETKDGAMQEALAAGAVKGLRGRLDRAYYGFFEDYIKVQVILCSPDGTVSNQILPSLSETDDPAAPGDCLGNLPNFDETYEDPMTMTFGYSGTQVATLDMTVAAPGTPGSTALDGSDIPNAATGFPAGTLVATQRLHTCYGNAVNGTLMFTQEGSELDELYAFTDATHLYVGLSGNLEDNNNKLLIFIDADPAIGENVLDSNGDPMNGFNALRFWDGRTLDNGFAPEHAYVVNSSPGTLFVDKFNLLEPNADPWTGIQEYLGSSTIPSADGTLTGGTNPNDNRFALDNSNDLGVLGTGNAGGLGIPSSATTGLEARIALSELGGSEDCPIRIMAVVGGGDGGYLSNQCLPSFAPDSGNVTNEGIAGVTGAFNFGQTDPLMGGLPAFDGSQVGVIGQPARGDINGDCCITAADVPAIVQVLLGIDQSAAGLYAADVNENGLANGDDIGPFLEALEAAGPCP